MSIFKCLQLNVYGYLLLVNYKFNRTFNKFLKGLKVSAHNQQIMPASRIFCPPNFDKIRFAIFCFLCQSNVRMIFTKGLFDVKIRLDQLDFGILEVVKWFATFFYTFCMTTGFCCLQVPLCFPVYLRPIFVSIKTVAEKNKSRGLLSSTKRCALNRRYWFLSTCL